MSNSPFDGPGLIDAPGGMPTVEGVHATQAPGTSGVYQDATGYNGSDYKPSNTKIEGIADKRKKDIEQTDEEFESKLLETDRVYTDHSNGDYVDSKETAKRVSARLQRIKALASTIEKERAEENTRYNKAVEMLQRIEEGQLPISEAKERRIREIVAQGPSITRKQALLEARDQVMERDSA